MTDYQVLQLLKAAGIEAVRKQENSARLLLTVRRGAEVLDVPLAEYRSELQSSVKELEEKKHDVLKNSYASRVMTEFTIGGGAPVKMEALKRDDQLSGDEKADKLRRLGEIDAETKRFRALMLALTHLQVHAAELLPQLRGKEVQPAQEVPVQTKEGKLVWSKGVKAAAMFCHTEAKRARTDDTGLLRICTAFLQRSEITDDPGLTPEQLCNIVRQIRLLDILD
jgi:hypothetical protein